MKTFQKIKSLDNEERFERKLITKVGKDNVATIEPTDELIVTEKIDGSNAQVRNHQGKLYCYSHHKELSKDNTLNGFYNFVQERYDDLLNLIPEGYAFFGEWLTPHRIKYPVEAYQKWYLFDIFEFDTDDTMTDNGKYLGFDRLVEELATFYYVAKSDIRYSSNEKGLFYQVPIKDVYTVPFYDNVLYIADSLKDVDTLRQKLSDKSILGAKNNQPEGIVVTDTDKMVPIDESCEGPLRVKAVNEAFKEVRSSKKPLGAGAKAAMEWANKYITEPRIEKKIYELQDDSLIPNDLSFDWMKDGKTDIIADKVLADALEESQETPEALTPVSSSLDNNMKLVRKYSKRLSNKVIALIIKGMI